MRFPHDFTVYVSGVEVRTPRRPAERPAPQRKPNIGAKGLTKLRLHRQALTAR